MTIAYSLLSLEAIFWNLAQICCKSRFSSALKSFVIKSNLFYSHFSSYCADFRFASCALHWQGQKFHRLLRFFLILTLFQIYARLKWLCSCFLANLYQNFPTTCPKWRNSAPGKYIVDLLIEIDPICYDDYSRVFLSIIKIRAKIP